MSVLKGNNLYGEEVYADATGSREARRDGAVVGLVTCAPDGFDPLINNEKRFLTVLELAHQINSGKFTAILSDADFDALAGEFTSNVASIANPRRLGTKDVWLVGTTEALNIAAPEDMARIRCAHLMATMASRYPEAGISFGCDGETDERKWYFFTKLHGDVTFGGEGTAALQCLADRAEEHLESWLRKGLDLPSLDEPGDGNMNSMTDRFGPG